MKKILINNNPTNKIKYINSRIYLLLIFIIIIQCSYILLKLITLKKSNEKNEFKNLLINNNQTFNCNIYSSNLNITELLVKINKTFENNGYVNINEIESKIPYGRNWKKSQNKINEINIGIQLDPNYVLRVMMTIASIMDSQKPKTKIRFHFAVVLNFKDLDMLKLYSLREKIREDVEFNFYNAKKVEFELKDLNTKGPGAVAKLLLPQLLLDDVEKLLVFDTGDLLVLRDLYNVYNWDMNGSLYVGVPGKRTGKYAKINKKNLKFILMLEVF